LLTGEDYSKGKKKGAEVVRSQKEKGRVYTPAVTGWCVRISKNAATLSAF
jgi:hypothetical protein